MKIETILHTDDTDLPPLEADQTRHIVAANGVYRERRFAFFHASTKVDPKVLGLTDYTQFCRLQCGKISRTLHRAMLGFFKYCYHLHGGEAALVLLYHPDQRQFRWHCPEQHVTMHWSFDRWVTSDCIAFDNPTSLPEGYIHFGDAHPHIGSAIPSMTDVRDDQDGLHIIAGQINGTPDYHIVFVVDGQRFRVAPELIFDDPHCPPDSQPPPAWCKRVRIERYVTYQSPRWKDDDSRRDESWDSGNGDTRA